MPLCDKHGTPMRASKDEGWFYCPHKEDDGTYCKFQTAPSVKSAIEAIDAFSQSTKYVDVAKIRDERIGVAGLLQALITAGLLKNITEEEIKRVLGLTRLIKKIVEENQ